jgi:hypothetical protein
MWGGAVYSRQRKGGYGLKEDGKDGKEKTAGSKRKEGEEEEEEGALCDVAPTVLDLMVGLRILFIYFPFTSFHFLPSSTYVFVSSCFRFVRFLFCGRMLMNFSPRFRTGSTEARRCVVLVCERYLVC